MGLANLPQKRAPAVGWDGGAPPSSSVGPVPSARPQSLPGAQALLHSNGDTSNEWDQLLTTTKSVAKADLESSVLGQEGHHTHFEQEEPG